MRWVCLLILALLAGVSAQPACPPVPLAGIENEQTEGFPQYLETAQKRALVVTSAVMNLSAGYYYADVAKRDWSRFTAKAIAATNEHAFYDAMRQWMAELKLIDGQSEFVSPRQIAAQNQAQARTGIIYSGDPPQKSYVIRLAQGGPAEQGGIRVRDKILAIDGEECWNFQMFRGEEGSQVILTIQSRNETPRDITLTRAMISYAPLIPTASRLTSNSGVGYIRVSGPVSSEEEINKLLEAYLQVAGGPDLQGLVLDLRGSSINWLEYVDALISPFLPGANYQIVYAPKSPVPSAHIVSASKFNWSKLPLVVLVDYATSRLSVWAAAMLQRRPKTLLVGNPTQPMNLLLNGPTLSDGSSLFYPSSALRFSDGNSLIGWRVIPSILMSEDWLNFPEGQDPYIKAALDALKRLK